MHGLLPSVSAAANASHDWWDKVVTRPDLMVQLTTALAILVVTLFISRWVSDAAKRLARRFVQNDADRTLPEFLSQVVRWMILTLGFVAIMNRLGVATASFITVLGAASLSIGLALQGTLGNVAAGLMLLFTKPYRIGDTVHVGEISGRVHRLGVFSTEIDNFDNIRVYVPNAKVFSSEICNLSTNGALKLEVRVDIGYDSDLEKALALLLDVARAQADALETHEPATSLVDFAASGITVRVWIWVLPSRGVAARTALIIAMKTALDAAGIDIPYPTQVAIARNQT